MAARASLLPPSIQLSWRPICWHCLWIESPTGWICSTAAHRPQVAFPDLSTSQDDGGQKTDPFRCRALRFGNRRLCAVVLSGSKATAPFILEDGPCTPPPSPCSLRSCYSLLQPDSYFSGAGSTIRPPPGFLVRASSTSGDDINNILRLSACSFFDGSTGPLFTFTTRDQSIRVHASLTPLRIPHAGRIVLLCASVDATVSFSSRRTLM
jgi:hypothetical protein